MMDPRRPGQRNRSAGETMKLQTQTDADLANQKFNHFHDAFIKQVRVASDAEFLADMPGAEQRQFATNEEELFATGLYGESSRDVELEIHHYNYDWPKQPRQRAIMVRGRSARIADELLAVVGVGIFSLEFAADGAGVSCSLSFHEESADPVRTAENARRVVLFHAPEAEIIESMWEE